MEKHPNPFDEFLKETLKGHQLAPPEEAKKAFLKEASAIIPGITGRLKWLYIPLFILLISGIIAIFYYREDSSTERSKEISIENVKSNPEPVINEANEPHAAIQSTQVKPVIPENSPKEITSVKHLVNNVPGEVSMKMAKVATTENPNVVLPASSVKDSETLEKSSETTSYTLAFDSVAAPAVMQKDNIYQPEPASPDSSQSSPAGVITESGKPPAGKPVPYVTAGAYYLPEWMFNTIEGSKFVNNFGIEAIFYHGPVSIRTGVGISVSKGITENAVEYNAYLGSYNKLDSITFTFNESNHNFSPNLYMSKEKVWDSIAKLDSTKISKRYTYLQIPLVLGFDFWQKGRFTIGVRIGTVMSILLNSKQLTGPYDPGENLVLGISNLSPDRVSINWQAIGGVDASMLLAKSVYFELEPEAKYYYQSIYEKSGVTKKPWSIGLRAAVIYKF